MLTAQLYSVRTDLEKEYEKVIYDLKSFGYDDVQVSGVFGKKSSELKDIFDRNGVSCISAHVGLAELLSDPDKAFEYYAEIGCKYIAVPWLPEERRPGRPGFESTIADIAYLGNKIKPYGMYLLYHNHSFEFAKIGDKYGLDVLFETVPKEILGTEFDIAWIKYAGADPVNYIKRYKGRVELLHLKDFVAPGFQKQPKMPISDGEGDFAFRPFGMGIMDMENILKAAYESGTKTYIIEQDEPSKGLTRLDGMRISAQNIQNMMLQLNIK